MADSNSINLPTGTFIERARGVYSRDSLQFGSGADELRIRPNTNKKQPSLTVTRYMQVQSTVQSSSGPVTKFVPVSVSVSVNMANDPAIAINAVTSLVQDAASVLTEANINAMLLSSTRVQN